MIIRRNGKVVFTSWCGRYIFTAIDVPEIRNIPLDKIDFNTLMIKYNLNKYLHNETGPAILNVLTGSEEYFLNGVQLREKELERFKHNLNFNHTLNNIIIGDSK